MPKKTEPKAVSLKLSLPGRNPGDATPNLAICPIDADGKVIETKKIPDSETFEVSAKAMATAKEIAIVSGDAEPEDALKSALRLSPEQLKLSAATDGRLTLAPDQIGQKPSLNRHGASKNSECNPETPSSRMPVVA